MTNPWKRKSLVLAVAALGGALVAAPMAHAGKDDVSVAGGGGGAVGGGAQHSSPLGETELPKVANEIMYEVSRHLDGAGVASLFDVSKDLRARLYDKGLRIASGPRELADAFADENASVIWVLGGPGATVSTKPTNPDTWVMATGQVHVTGDASVRFLDGNVTVDGEAEVLVEGPTQVTASENAIVGARVNSSGAINATGEAEVLTEGSGPVVASDKVFVESYGEASVTLSGQAKGEVYGSGHVSVDGIADVKTYGAAPVTTKGEGAVMSEPSATGKVTASELSLVTTFNAPVEAFDSAMVFVHGGSVIGHGNNVRIFTTIESEKDVTVDPDTDTVRITDEDTMMNTGIRDLLENW